MAAKTSSGVNPKSVTILAMGPTTNFFIDELDVASERPTEYIWAINNAGMWLDDIDLIISMDDLRRDITFDPEYVKGLTGRGIPLLTSTAYEEYPSTMDYPLKEVLDYLDIEPGEIHPLDNSCNYSLAYAMYKGMKEISLVGYEFRASYSRTTLYEADKFAKEKYGDDVPFWFKYYMKDYMTRASEPGEFGCCYLMGMCKERGIHINLAFGTTLMNADLPVFYYGYQIQPEFDK